MNWDFLFKWRKEPAPVDLNLEVTKGNEAESLLNSPAYMGAMRRVREGIHERWAASPLGDVEGQHELRLILKAVDDIEGNLRNDVATGKMAAQQIKLIREDEQRKQERKDRKHIRAI